MASFIKAISYYLPDTIVSNQDLVEEFPEWSVDKIAKKVGVVSRHVVAVGQCASDLAEQAARKLFLENDIDKSCIDFMLLCTQSPDYFLPTTACLLQEKLGLGKYCGALDFNLGCSGFVYGLALAKGLIESDAAKNVLLITAETYTRHIHHRDKGNRTIFGDAAAATLVSTSGFAEIGSFGLGTDGSGANNLIVKSGAMRHQDRFDDIAFDKSGNPVSSDSLYMNGSEIFNFTLETVPDLVENVLRKNRMDKESVDLYVFHQANKYMLDCLFDLMEIEEKKTFVYMSEVGNTVSSTIPIALCEAKKEQKLSGKVLIAGFGVGYSWGGCVLTCK
jgi:3-oxoacyl-[acyl-carrier-protein] synthase-3